MVCGPKFGKAGSFAKALSFLTFLALMNRLRIQTTGQIRFAFAKERLAFMLVFIVFDLVFTLSFLKYPSVFGKVGSMVLTGQK